MKTVNIHILIVVRNLICPFSPTTDRGPILGYQKVVTEIQKTGVELEGHIHYTHVAKGNYWSNTII